MGGHEHSHGHGHDHAGHSHGATADSDKRWLAGALAVIVAFLLGEVVVGLVARSLALLSDAAHMLTDAASIVLALWAIRLAAKPAEGRMTYGWKRAEILSAQANGLTLLGLAAWLTYEAIRRLIDPPDVTGGLVLVTALVGIVVNVLASWMISRANRTSLNVEGAYQHILNDLFAFIATAVAGLIIMLTGFTRADGIATLIVVVLMVKAGVGLVRASGRIFLEAAPTYLDPVEIGREMADVDSVVEVHDLHIWEITSGVPSLSAHILVAPGADSQSVRAAVAHMLADKHHIDHAVLQVDFTDHDECPPDVDHDHEPHCAEPHGPVHRKTSAAN
ncbi:cation diffusion facilitator family transporter [Nocardia sp. ET3-3]|uniref:Cation diffusion facilitator family transporter n=1 Tax=Nocardia terrae TaxID=2675851 RepID=A0A7K1UXR4_9NOCA|nr:cation diffusion facilitator family transporter [Nocardia terrae]MVU79115.1 cation diffusion facilitator family transporter [Nocardia terrae]